MFRHSINRSHHEIPEGAAQVWLAGLGLHVPFSKHVAANKSVGNSPSLHLKCSTEFIHVELKSIWIVLVSTYRGIPQLTVCVCVCVCVCVFEREKKVGNGICPLSIEWRLYAHILF